MIQDAILKIYKQHGTYEPKKIADQKDISILYIDLDIESYGMTICSNRCKTIIINSRIPDRLQEFTIAHELGHCFLHNELSTPFMRRSCAYSTISKLEAEAHQFAFILLSKVHPEMCLMNKYTVIEYFCLPAFMERFMNPNDF